MNTKAFSKLFVLSSINLGEETGRVLLSELSGGLNEMRSKFLAVTTI